MSPARAATAAGWRSRALVLALAIVVALFWAGPGVAQGGAQEGAPGAAQNEAAGAAPETAPGTAPETAPETALAQGGPSASQATQSQATQVASALMEDWGDIDYAAWDNFANRVETALESGKVSDSVLGDLRRDLVTWRATFAEARSSSSVRIDALRAQIDTLGAPPEEGASEPEAIASQRAALDRRLEAALAPVTRAELAHSRAETLVVTLDQSLRARQVRDVSARDPSPFDVTNWVPAVQALTRTFSLAWSKAISSWTNATQSAILSNDLPLTIPFGLAGLVLLLFGWRSVRRIGEQLRAGKSESARGAWGFAISAMQVIVPSFGAVLVGGAISLGFVLDSRGEQIVGSFVDIIVVQFFARWIGNRVFGIPGASWRVLDLPRGQVRYGHALAASLGVLGGLQILLEDLGDTDAYSAATLAVLNFPLIAVTAVVLWQLGRMLRRYDGGAPMAADSDTGEGPGPVNFFNQTIRGLGTLVVVVAFAAPIAAALGFRNGAIFALFPSIKTLALIAVLLIVHHFIIDIYAMLTRRSRAEAAQSLVPVLASVCLALAVTPLLPLIWGYRVSDLTEFWEQIVGGVTLGGAEITPLAVLTVAVVFSIGYGVTRLVQGVLSSTILPKTAMETGGQVALTSGVGYVGIFLAGLAAVTAAGIDLSSLAIVAGALSVGIGFGLQAIVSNFVSGIILLIERPIGKGDWIEVGGQQGIVKEISVRATRIETWDRNEVIVPNADLISGTVKNWTRGNLLGRVIVPVGVAYGTDTGVVDRILRAVAEAHPLVTVNPAPQVLFRAFGADSLEFEVRVILRDVNFSLSVASELHHEIARRFAEAGIEIPFAQRDLWLRNPEVLAGQGGGPVAGAGAGPVSGPVAAPVPAAPAPTAPPGPSQRQPDLGDRPSGPYEDSGED